MYTLPLITRGKKVGTHDKHFCCCCSCTYFTAIRLQYTFNIHSLHSLAFHRSYFGILRKKMHLPRLAVVLMATVLPAIANAGGGQCTHMNAKRPSRSVDASVQWMNRAVIRLMNGMLEDLLDIMKGTLRKRREEEAMMLYWLDCVTSPSPTTALDFDVRLRDGMREGVDAKKRNNYRPG